MEKLLRILLLEDSLTDAEMIQRILKKNLMPVEIRLAMTKAVFLQALTEYAPDVVLSDNSVAQYNAVAALESTRSVYPYLPFIMVTGTVPEEYAANIIKQGADDYILKDRMARLPAAITSAIQQRKVLKEISDYKYGMDQAAIVAITDQRGLILYANENFCKISKYRYDELIGQDHRIINSKFHPPEFIRQLWVTIANGNIWRGEFRNRAKDGALYWVDTTIVPFLNDKGKPYQYLSIRTDITSRKKMEQELIESKSRFQNATRASSDIIWELDFETKKYQVHEGMERLFSEKEKQLQWNFGIEGKYIAEEDRKRVTSSFRKASKDPGCELWQEEYRINSLDNKSLYIVNHAVFIRNQTGAAIRAIGAISDITTRKKLEDELLNRQLQEQLRLTATALDAQEKERNAIGQELHDNVNQILVGTKLFLGLIQNDPEKNLHLIDFCLESLQEAISENRKIAHVLVTPDLEEKTLTEQLLTLTASMFPDPGIDVRFDFSNFIQSRLSKEQQLAVYRIAQEQCTNIVKYAAATQIDFLLLTGKNHFKMAIADNGKGMKASTKTTGIGLKNINGRLSIFNGKASTKSTPGKGFTLEIEFPVREAR